MGVSSTWKVIHCVLLFGNASRYIVHMPHFLCTYEHQKTFCIWDTSSTCMDARVVFIEMIN